MSPSNTSAAFPSAAFRGERFPAPGTEQGKGRGRDAVFAGSCCKGRAGLIEGFVEICEGLW